MTMVTENLGDGFGAVSRYCDGMVTSLRMVNSAGQYVLDITTNRAAEYTDIGHCYTEKNRLIQLQKDRMISFLEAPGHLYDEEGRFLQEQARNKVVLDIGTHLGRSAIAMAATAEHVVTIDNYAGDTQIGAPSADTTIKCILKSGLSHKISIMAGDWLELLMSLQLRRVHNFGFIFYDASHRPPTYEEQFLDRVWHMNCSYAVHDYKLWDPNMSDVVVAVDAHVAARGKWSSEAGSIRCWER